VDLLDEGEQWEAVKAWVRQNGLAILAGALIGILGLAGWRWWQARTATQALAANGAYQQLLATFDSGDMDAALKQLDQLRKDYPDSAYAAPAELATARMHVARNELDKAAERLRSVADTAHDTQLRTVARLRLARVQLAQGKPDDALLTLGSADLGAFQSIAAEVRGDALFAKGDKAGALREYLAAQTGRKDGSQQQQVLDGAADLLELKINDLRAEAPATAAAPKS
jgi:predicted negative regulator of RcsB-dependent stress response